MQKELHAPKEKPPVPSVEATREFHQEAVRDTQKYAQAQNEIARKEARQERASKRWNRERSYFAKVIGFLSREEYLLKERTRLQQKRKTEVENAWGEGNVVTAIYHVHTSGSKEAGYKGSPDGLFSEDIERPKTGENPRILTIFGKMDINYATLTNHDVEDFDKMNNAKDALNKKAKGIKFVGGTEMTSKEGHLIIMEGASGKPVKGVPPAKTPPVEVAEWAFENGYDVMIPHPNPSRADPKRFAAWLFKIDISIEKEYVENILRLADKHDRLVYIERSNGTTSEDYMKCLLSPTRDPWWNFLKPKTISKETKELFLRRAVWIDGADMHRAGEVASGLVYIRKDKVTGSDGKISQEKICEAVREQKQIELEAMKFGRKLEDKDCVFISNNADSAMNVLGQVSKRYSSLWEYGRLIVVWLSAALRGEAKQFAPEQKYTHQPFKAANVRAQYENMAEFEE